MAVFSSWRDEISLSEVVTDNLNSKKDKKITGEGVNNKKLIKVFPDVKEQLANTVSSQTGKDDKLLSQKEKRINVAKRQIVQKKMQALRSGAGHDIVASNEPEGQMVEGNQRDPEGSKKDRTHSKQPDPSKDGFTGIGNMSIKDIMKMNAKIKAKSKKESVEPEEEMVEAKVDAGKSPETKEKDRNVRKFGVSHNVAGHGKLRRALHRSDRGDKKIKGDKTQWVETEEVALEEVGISSSAAMEKARKEAELKAKEDAAIKKAKKIKESRMDREPPSWSSMNPEDEGNPEYEKTQSYEDEQKWKKKQQKKKLKKEEIEMESYELTEELINDSIEDAIDYFSKQGINEEGLDLIIEEVGLDDFVEFVLDPSEDLMEARKARRANVKAKSYAQVKSEVDASDAAKKKAKKGEYATSYAKKETDVTVYDDKPAAKKKAPAKKAAPKPVVKKVTVKKAAPVKKAETKKKVVAATQTAKKKQPLKPISKPGLGSKIRSAVSKGVERHKAAVGKAKTEVGKVVKTAKATAKQHSQHRKDFVKGISPTDKEKKIAKGVGGAVKKSLTREELEVLENAKYGYDKDGKSLKPEDKEDVPQKEEEDDYRAMWTKANLVRQKLRAMGLNMSHEPEGDLIQDEYTVTNSDKTGNTKAWQNYQKNVKNVKTGKPLYKKADHVKESRDKALDIVRANIIKKHGEGAIYDAKRDRPSEAQKKAASAERNKRQAEKNKAFADRAKKAGYKSTQDYANVVARYGSEDNMKKGKGLGT